MTNDRRPSNSINHSSMGLCPGCLGALSHADYHSDGSRQCPDCSISWQGEAATATASSELALTAARNMVAASGIAQLAGVDADEVISHVCAIFDAAYGNKPWADIDAEQADDAVSEAVQFIKAIKSRSSLPVRRPIASCEGTSNDENEVLTGEILTPIKDIKLPERDCTSLGIESQWLTTVEAANELMVSPDTLRRWLHDDQLSSMRTQHTSHGYVRWSHADVAWAREQLMGQLTKQAAKMRFARRVATWLRLPHMHQYLELRAELMWAQTIRRTVEVSQQRCECGCERRVVRLPMSVGKRTLQIQQVAPGTWQLDVPRRLKQIAA